MKLVRRVLHRGGEREWRVDELMANLARLEADEEALIETAVSEGLDMLRRQNADPKAVLGVVVAAKQKALAAA
jgi:hypothetical protein